MWYHLRLMLGKTTEKLTPCDHWIKEKQVGSGVVLSFLVIFSCYLRVASQQIRIEGSESHGKGNAHLFGLGRWKYGYKWTVEMRFFDTSSRVTLHKGRCLWPSNSGFWRRRIWKGQTAISGYMSAKNTFSSRYSSTQTKSRSHSRHFSPHIRRYVLVFFSIERGT